MKLAINPNNLKGLVVGILLTITLSITFLAPLRVFIQSQLYATGIGINYLTKFIFGGKAQLQEDLNSVKDERDFYIDQVTEINNLREINRELREVISFSERESEPYSFHNIISNFRYLGLEKLIADNNRSEIDSGEAVVVSNGHIIGRVGNVYDYEFEVVLLQDKNSSIPASILGTEGATGVVKGQGGFRLRMEYIPAQLDIAPGQIVVSQPIGDLVPPGLVIGSVKEVEKVSSSPFQTALIEPFVNPYEYSIIALR